MPPANIIVGFLLTGNSPDTQQFLNRLVTPSLTARETIYGALIDGLKSDGLSALLEFLLILAAADPVTGFTDILSGSVIGKCPVLFCNFVADQGIKPLSNGYFDTGFNLSTGTKFVRNSACIFGWNLSTSPIGYCIGTGSAAESHIAPYNGFASNHTQWAINSASEVDSGVVATDASGFWLANRTGASASAIYQNGVQLATSSVASVAPTNATLQCNNTATCRVAVVGAGAGLTAPQITALFNRLNTYLHAIGAV